MCCFGKTGRSAVTGSLVTYQMRLPLEAMLLSSCITAFITLVKVLANIISYIYIYTIIMYIPALPDTHSIYTGYRCIGW